MKTMIKLGLLTCFLLSYIAPAVAVEVDHVVVYKGKRQMLLMAKDTVVKQYHISLGRNPIGHKEFEGDKKTPEGNYILDYRNPNSKYHKSIHISYPNKADILHAQQLGVKPGGMVMIHGIPDQYNWASIAFTSRDWTYGCIALNNKQLDEVWSLVKDGTPITIKP